MSVDLYAAHTVYWNHMHTVWMLNVPIISVYLQIIISELVFMGVNCMSSQGIFSECIN